MARRPPISFRPDVAFGQHTGYTSSNLRDFIAERPGGTIAAADVRSLPSTTSGSAARSGSPRSSPRCPGSAGWSSTARRTPISKWSPLGRQLAQDAGKTFLTRSGPSFVRALACFEAKDVLAQADLAIDASRTRHGLIAVGSHVGLTTRRVQEARQRGSLVEVELGGASLARRVDRGDHHRRDRGEDRRRPPWIGRAGLHQPRSGGRGQRPGSESGHRPHGVDGARHRGREGPRGPPRLGHRQGRHHPHDLAFRGLGIRRATVAGQFCRARSRCSPRTRPRPMSSAAPSSSSLATSVESTPWPWSSTGSGPRPRETGDACPWHRSARGRTGGGHRRSSLDRQYPRGDPRRRRCRRTLRASDAHECGAGSYRVSGARELAAAALAAAESASVPGGRPSGPLHGRG